MEPKNNDGNFFVMMALCIPQFSGTFIFFYFRQAPMETHAGGGRHKHRPRDQLRPEGELSINHKDNINRQSHNYSQRDYRKHRPTDQLKMEGKFERRTAKDEHSDLRGQQVRMPLKEYFISLLVEKAGFALHNDILSYFRN